MYSRRYWPNNLIGLPFSAFAVFWTLGACGYLDGWNSKTNEPAPLFVVLWGMMFVAIGLVVLFSPLWGRIRAERMYYVLTPKRALIFERLFVLKIRSIPVDALRGFERGSFGGEGGDIVFRRTITGSGRGRREEVIGFIGIDSYRDAETALLSLARSDQ